MIIRLGDIFTIGGSSLSDYIELTPKICIGITGGLISGLEGLKLKKLPPNDEDLFALIPLQAGAKGLLLKISFIQVNYYHLIEVGGRCS